STASRRRPTAWSSATPTAPRRKRSASGGRKADSHPPLDVGVDGVRSAVHVVEDLGHAENTRAVADSQPEIGLAQFLRPEEIAHAHVDGRVGVLQQLRGVASAPRLVPRLHERRALRVGAAPAEADTRAHTPAPGKSPVERLELAAELPEV